MSIIIGVVTNNCALVASDGRLFSGAYFENGQRLIDSTIKSDDFDKTFVLKNGNLTGAVAGTMSFSEKKIAEHLMEITDINNLSNDILIDTVSLKLKDKLENISPEEIGYSFRKLDLILTYATGELRNEFKIRALRFYPNTNNTSIEFETEEIYPKIKGHVSWKLFGDDSSQKKINSFFEEEIYRLAVPNEKNLRSLLYKAIRLGIKSSEKNKNGTDLNCGGKVFVKSIKT